MNIRSCINQLTGLGDDGNCDQLCIRGLYGARIRHPFYDTQKSVKRGLSHKEVIFPV